MVNGAWKKFPMLCDADHILFHFATLQYHMANETKNNPHLAYGSIYYGQQGFLIW